MLVSIAAAAAAAAAAAVTAELLRRFVLAIKSLFITTLKELPDALSSLQLSNDSGRSISIPSAGTARTVAALLSLPLVNAFCRAA